MQLTQLLTALVVTLFAAPWCARAAVSHTVMERVLMEEITKTAANVLEKDKDDISGRELRRMLQGVLSGQVPTNSIFGASNLPNNGALALLPALALGGQMLSPTSVALDQIDNFIANLTGSYCTPLNFNPPTTRGATFVGPKLAIKINRGSCVLAEDIELATDITVDEYARPRTVTVTNDGSITTTLVCFGHSIKFIKTPPTIYSKTKIGACLTTPVCQARFLWGLESFRYLSDAPVNNITIPLESLSATTIAAALGYSAAPVPTRNFVVPGITGSPDSAAATAQASTTSASGGVMNGWGGWSFSMSK